MSLLSPAECDHLLTVHLMDTSCSHHPTRNPGGYGSMVAVKEWLHPEISEASSTCCSSSCEEDMTLSVHSSTMASPDEDDAIANDLRQGKQHLIGQLESMLKYQDTFMTAATCTSSSYSLDDDIPTDMEMGHVVVQPLVSDAIMIDDATFSKGNLCGAERDLRLPGWELYNQCLDHHPVTTKACTSLTGWFLGDLVTQTVITGGPFDFHRSMVLASFGFFFHGPAGHVVYDNLDKVIDGKGPREIAAKIMVDQVLWCPIFMICYFTYIGFANGEMPATILAKIHSDLWTAVQGSWKVWILAHAIQFRYVATKHRIVYINCVEVCFIMFLSW